MANLLCIRVLWALKKAAHVIPSNGVSLSGAGMQMVGPRPRSMIGYNFWALNHLLYVLFHLENKELMFFSLDLCFELK